MREVIFYRLPNRECPVEEFLDLLNRQHQEKFAWVLKLIKEIPFVSKQYFKKLVGTDDIWEIRVDSGSDTIRLLGFYDKGNLVVVTNGFVKKSEKIPAGEIKLAEQRKQDYERRRDG